MTRPGGRVLVLEFSKVWKPLAKPYDAYSFNVLPWLGKHVAKDEAAYQYLAESIRMHPDQETLKGMMETAGLVKVRVLQPHHGRGGAAPGLQAVIGQASAPLVAAAINRLTGPAPLSRERLGRFAGKTALFRVGPVAVSLTVQTTGEVLPAAEAAAPDLEVRLSPFLLPRLAAHDEAAYRDVETLGDVEFAGEVAFLAKHLKWDVEEDLSKVVGDAAAHRLVSAARARRGVGQGRLRSAWPPAPRSTLPRRTPSSPRA